MKIVFLCNEYPPCPKVGGIGIFTHTIAHALVDSGHEVTILGYGKDHGERNDHCVKVVILTESKIRGLAWFINRWRLYLWLKRRVCAAEMDILEIPEYQGMLPFKFPWCPVVVRLHGSGRRANISARILEKQTLKLHIKWIGVSNWIMQETQEKYNIMPKNAEIIYNPVDVHIKTQVNIPVDLPENFVLYAGTVSDRKGAFVLAEAAREFLSHYPDLHLVYVGGLNVENGQRADQTIHNILGEKFRSRVHFTGRVDHDIVLSCMSRAKVFAFPSKLEAFSLVPLEAMSCGVPVIYSKLHSGPEAIDDEVTGLLADPNNPDDVAAKVLRILDNPELGVKMSKNARYAVKERFSLEKCVDSTLKFYRQSLMERNLL